MRSATRCLGGVAVLAALGLAGCASPWQRPGASKAQAAQDQGVCLANALKKAPVHVQREQIVGGYWQPATEHCEQRHDTQDCVFYPASWVPPLMGDVDVNKGVRRALVDACMRAHGYTR